MDFFQITEKFVKDKDGYSSKDGESEGGKSKSLKLDIYPDFRPIRSKDLMVRGRSFYAIWDKEKHMWSTDECDVQRLVDGELDAYANERKKKYKGRIDVKRMLSYSSNVWRQYKSFLKDMFDTYHQLDSSLTFSNTKVTKEDYVSKRVPYPLVEGPIDAYLELIGTLFNDEERAKLEWAVGSIISGDSKTIQKFIVLYGEAGSGKSTFLNIVQKLFEGYYTTFEAKALTSSNNSFSMEMFQSNPLVAIQHDGDLSRIEDNTKLNSIVSHEEMTINEKFKAPYTSRINAFLFMGTNKPVRITDAKSGIIRRLIDVHPSGRHVNPQRYYTLMSQIDFELGAIASHCLKVYQEMGKNYYSGYRPLEMMYQTDVFFNFVEDSYYVFNKQDGATLSQAYDMYKSYCDEALVEFKLPKYKFREELKSYFREFSERVRVDGKQYRNYFSGFLSEKFNQAPQELTVEEKPYSLTLDQTNSKLDELLKDCPAQYANAKETPIKKWDEVTTTLSDIDSTRLHYVRPPENLIVIDFDLKDASGKKSMDKNLEEASKWPATYAEFSKSGSAVHLHYIYEGDVSKLSRVYDDDIEIKVFTGNSSLRRKLSKCNLSPIATINSGLPLKGEKVLNFNSVKSEKGLRNMIKRNLAKEIHPGTKPSIDFIYQILEDANASGLHYDVTDMRPAILAFANNSTHQADYCIKLVLKMKFMSDEPSNNAENYDSDALIFYDVEVFPNLFVIVWKKEGQPCVRMINPSASDVEELMKFKLVGFNCRRYDNQILYASYIGYTNYQLYELSQRIINGSKNAMFREAYNISYTDIYDFASAGHKKSLKKFEIEMGIHHQELGLPWDKPVPEDMWDTVADYCCNDVEATEATFHYLSGDWAARQILAELSGLSVNDTTNQHSTKIMFGNDKHPQEKFEYTDLSTMFPGYTFENGKSTYRGEDPKEGGYVYSEPGMYTDVLLLDIASMHPTSIEQLNLFGPYTKRFSEIKSGRIAIKHQDWDHAKEILDGKLAPFIAKIQDGTASYSADDLAAALKTVINSVYGLTSAKFDNPFKDPRNIDNIVAKRGALFMIDLKHAVQDLGYHVAHIKTDSIKIPYADDKIKNFIIDFGKKYGYNFEHEATYSKMCLVNDAVYIAKYDEFGIRNKHGKHANEWTATGTQFAQPYVFKTLFSKEPIEFEDMCETKTVTSSLFLDMNENLPDVSEYEKEKAKLVKELNGAYHPDTDRTKQLDDLSKAIEKGHDYHFIGKTGAFCPIKAGCGGGILLREKDRKYYAATGSKGYRWLEAEMVKELGKEDDIDRGFYNSLVDNAVKDISEYGDFEWFSSNATSPKKKDDSSEVLPLELAPCFKDQSLKCEVCKERDEKGSCKYLPF